MTITQEKIADLKSLVKINLTKEDYEPKVTTAIKKLQKKADMKGFRPGMVPMPVVKKMYGNSVLADEINNELNEQMWKYIQDNNLNILGQPIPAADQSLLDIDINNMQDVHFTYEVGHAPEFDLSYIDGGATFTKYKIEVSEQMIDEEVDRIRKRFATYEYPEVVEGNDILSLTIEELKEDGTLKEGGVSTVSSVMADLIKPEHKADFLNMKKLDVITKNVWELMDRDREGIAKNILNLNDLSKIDEVGNSFQLTLNNITRSKPAEINEEFFKKVYGEGDVTTETEMRNKIKGEVESYLDGQSDGYLVNDLYKGIMDNVDFTLPDDFMKRWLKVANDKKTTEDEIEKDYPKFAKQLRWDLITRRIIKENNIENSPEELQERARMQTIQQLYSYGMRDMGGDWIQEFINKQLKDKKYMEQVSDQLLTDKVMFAIKSKVKLNIQPISLEDFKAMAEKEEA